MSESRQDRPFSWTQGLATLGAAAVVVSYFLPWIDFFGLAHVTNFDLLRSKVSGRNFFTGDSQTPDYVWVLTWGGVLATAFAACVGGAARRTPGGAFFLVGVFAACVFLNQYGGMLHDALHESGPVTDIGQDLLKQLTGTGVLAYMGGTVVLVAMGAGSFFSSSGRKKKSNGA